MTRFSKRAAIVTTAFVAYAGALIALRPWHTRWGATDEELSKRLPGDELVPNRVICNHAITIDAPGGRLMNFLFWDPAHFIMECGMLLGIKRSAEQRFAC